MTAYSASLMCRHVPGVVRTKTTRAGGVCVCVCVVVSCKHSLDAGLPPNAATRSSHFASDSMQAPRVLALVTVDSVKSSYEPRRGSIGCAECSV